jgi:TatD DNase family protein
MRLIDTHAHHYLNEFKDDLPAVLARAGLEKIDKILMPAIDASTHVRMLETERQYPSVFVSMMGLHPCSVKENYKDELKIAEEYLSKRKFIAVGETGLDFYWDLTFKEQQYDAFRQQIEWALQYDIPVVIHSRDSTEECIRTVAEHQRGKLKGVFHCFTGNQEQARQIIDLGFYLGVGGVLTFKNAGLDRVIKDINLEHIVVETDAPYLAPAPFRGKRNESSYLKYIAEKLAAIKQMNIEEVAAITTRNAEKLFSL